MILSLHLVFTAVLQSLMFCRNGGLLHEDNAVKDNSKRC